MSTFTLVQEAQVTYRSLDAAGLQNILILRRRRRKKKEEEEERNEELKN